MVRSLFVIICCGPIFAQAAPSSASQLDVSKVHYSIPILFDPVENGVEIAPQKFEYHLEDSGQLKIGNIQIDNRYIFIRLSPDQTKPDSEAIKFTWPKNLVAYGHLELKSQNSDKVFFSQDITPEQVSESLTVGDARNSNDEVLAADQGHFEKSISLQQLKTWPSRKPFVFCLSKMIDSFKTGFCSKQYRLEENEHGFYEVVGSEQEYTQVVIINGTKAKNKNVIEVKDQNQKLSFDIRVHDGSDYKIETRASALTSPHIDIETSPSKLNFDDIVYNPKSNIVTLTGHNVAPAGSHVQRNGDYWIVKFPKDKPTLYFPGIGDFPFKQDLKFTKPLPTEENRAYLKRNSKISTYSSEALLHGLIQDKEYVTSHENEAHQRSDQTFDWNFKSSQKGMLNKSHLVLKDDDGNDYVGNYEVYRGYPFEAAGRFTVAFAQTSKALILGELLASAWLEQIFKSENAIWSVERWGVSAKYLNTLSSGTDSNGNPINLVSTNVDVNYRLTPGIWNQDKTFGIKLGFQNVIFESENASMLGVGAFWVNPMPSQLDKVLNAVKWLRYPKVIEAEAEYYPLSMTSGATLGANFNLMVRGKLFIKPKLFIDGGVGFNQYNFSQSNQYSLQSSMVFGSGGMGLDF